MKTDHRAQEPGNVLNLQRYAAEKGSEQKSATPVSTTFLQLKRELEVLPYPVRSTEALLFASKLVEDAGYSLVQERQSSEVTQLFLIAAELEKRVTRLVNG